jgi:hypothetical protein
MEKDNKWIKHIKRLAEDKAKLQVEVRSLRLEVTRLTDELCHYQKEFSRQNAKLLTLMIQAES